MMSLHVLMSAMAVAIRAPGPVLNDTDISGYNLANAPSVTVRRTFCEAREILEMIVVIVVHAVYHCNSASTINP